MSRKPETEKIEKKENTEARRVLTKPNAPKWSDRMAWKVSLKADKWEATDGQANAIFFTEARSGIKLLGVEVKYKVK